MANDEVAIKLRLRDAKKFQADASRSGKAIEGRPGLKGFGGWMGHAAGAGMAVGIGLELEHWLSDHGYIDKAGQFLADKITGVDGKKQAAQNRKSFAANKAAGERTIRDAQHPSTGQIMGTNKVVPVRGRSRGGFVGGAGRGDVSPMMADPREFVLRPEATARLGSDALHALNRGQAPAPPVLRVVSETPWVVNLNGHQIAAGTHRAELRTEGRR